MIWLPDHQRLALKDGTEPSVAQVREWSRGTATASAFGHHVLETFQTCNKAAHLSHEQRLGARITNVPLMVGTAVHHGLRLWHHHNATEDDAVVGATASCGTAKYLYPETPSENILAAIAQATVLLRGYFTHWPRESEPFEFVHAEAPFAIQDIDGYTGTIDGIIKFKDAHQFGGKWFVMERKTTSMTEIDKATGAVSIRKFLEGFAISRDITGYLVGATCIKDLPFSGILLDVLTKTDPPAYFRVPILRSLVDVQLWMRETLQIISQLRSCQSTGIWPRNTSMCSRWGGWGRPCVFQGVCKYGEDERIIEALFQRG